MKTALRTLGTAAIAYGIGKIKNVYSLPVVKKSCDTDRITGYSLKEYIERNGGSIRNYDRRVVEYLEIISLNSIPAGEIEDMKEKRPKQGLAKELYEDEEVVDYKGDTHVCYTKNIESGEKRFHFVVYSEGKAIKHNNTPWFSGDYGNKTARM